MKLRLTSLVLLLALFGTFALAAPRQAAAQTNVDLTFPVSGELETGGTFEGTLSNLSFALNAAGDLVVSGVLNGTATSATGVVTTITDQAFDVVGSLLNPGGGKCDILFLDLGPIELDLLGLEVDLSRIVLDIDAVPGAGNLLGNLLCTVARLLDNPGNTLGGLLNLLGRINNILG